MFEIQNFIFYQHRPKMRTRQMGNCKIQIIYFHLKIRVRTLAILPFTGTIIWNSNYTYGKTSITYLKQFLSKVKCTNGYNFK